MSPAAIFLARRVDMRRLEDAVFEVRPWNGWRLARYHDGVSPVFGRAIGQPWMAVQP